MASNDTLKLQIANFESDEVEKENQIIELQTEVEELKDKLENIDTSDTSSSIQSDFDLGSVFIEAKKTADRVVTEAKKAAKKMEDDASELQNQMLDEANEQAEGIVKDAQDKATKTVDEADAQAQITISQANEQAEMTILTANEESESTLSKANSEAEKIREGSADLRNSVQSEFTALDESVTRISTVLRELFGDNMVKLDNAKELVEQGLGLVNGDSNFNYSLKGSGAALAELTIEDNKNNNDYNEEIEVAQENISDEISQDEIEEYEEVVHSADTQEIEEMMSPQDSLQAELDKLALLVAEAEIAAPYEPAVVEEESYINEEEFAEELSEESEEEPVVELEEELVEELEDEPVEEVEEPVEAEKQKPSNYSKSFDLDMLTALTKEIESKENKEPDPLLSDDDILKKYSKK